jgi:hypothetical protein
VARLSQASRSSPSPGPSFQRSLRTETLPSSTPSRCAVRSWTDQPGQAVGCAQSPHGRLAGSAASSARSRGTSGLASTRRKATRPSLSRPLSVMLAAEPAATGHRAVDWEAGRRVIRAIMAKVCMKTVPGHRAIASIAQRVALNGFWVTWSGGMAREAVTVFRHVRGRRGSWRVPPSLSRFRHGALRGSSHGPILWSRSCHTCTSSRPRTFCVLLQDITRARYRVREITICRAVSYPHNAPQRADARVR